MAMLDTAEIVAKRYNISRERRTSTASKASAATAAAQQGGRFNDEIAPITTNNGSHRQGDQSRVTISR